MVNGIKKKKGGNILMDRKKQQRYLRTVTYLIIAASLVMGSILTTTKIKVYADEEGGTFEGSSSEGTFEGSSSEGTSEGSSSEGTSEGSSSEGTSGSSDTGPSFTTGDSAVDKAIHDGTSIVENGGPDDQDGQTVTGSQEVDKELGIGIDQGNDNGNSGDVDSSSNNGNQDKESSGSSDTGPSFTTGDSAVDKAIHDGTSIVENGGPDDQDGQTVTGSQDMKGQDSSIYPKVEYLYRNAKDIEDALNRGGKSIIREQDISGTVSKDTRTPEEIRQSRISPGERFIGDTKGMAGGIFGAYGAFVCTVFWKCSPQQKSANIGMGSAADQALLAPFPLYGKGQAPSTSKTGNGGTPMGGGRGPMAPDQQSLKDLVNEATNGGRKPLSGENAETVINWAKEYKYQGSRASESDLAPENNHWKGGPHIHLPGAGKGGHVPVNQGVVSPLRSSPK